MYFLSEDGLRLQRNVPQFPRLAIISDAEAVFETSGAGLFSQSLDKMRNHKTFPQQAWPAEAKVGQMAKANFQRGRRTSLLASVKLGCPYRRPVLINVHY